MTITVPPTEKKNWRPLFQTCLKDSPMISPAVFGEGNHEGFQYLEALFIQDAVVCSKFNTNFLSFEENWLTLASQVTLQTHCTGLIINFHRSIRYSTWSGHRPWHGKHTSLTQTHGSQFQHDQCIPDFTAMCIPFKHCEMGNIASSHWWILATNSSSYGKHDIWSLNLPAPL